MPELSNAERELLSIYTRQAYDAYLSENLNECEQRVGQIEALNPGNIHALFLKGAIAGRKARPGESMNRILQAVRIWKPLFEQLEGQTGQAMQDAISEAFSTILYIPVELSSRQWDVYCDARTARELAGTIRTLLNYDGSFAAQQDAYSQWIHSLFVKNYVFLVDEVIGMNKAVPVGPDSENVRAYGETLTELVRMAELIPDSGESEAAVKARALQRMQSYREHNQITG